MRAATILPGSLAEMNASAAAPSRRGSTASAACSRDEPFASSSSRRWTTTSVSVSLVNACPRFTSGAFRSAKFSMIPLWITAVTPPQSTCGWAFCSVGRPCVAQRVWPIPVVLFDRDAQHRFGPGGPHQEPARRAERGARLLERIVERAALLPLAPARRGDVARHLRPALDRVGELRERPLFRLHQMKDLERREDAVPGRVVLAKDDVSGRLAAELRVELLHLLPHVAVADLRAHETDAVARERRLEPAVRHDGPHDELGLELPVPREMPCGEREHEVAVVDAAGAVHRDDAIAVAVEREADVAPALHDRTLQRFGSGRTAALVDVRAVGHVEERDDLGAGLCEDGRRDAIGGAVRAVEHDTQAL